MFSVIITTTFRIIATITIITPILLNVIWQGKIITSLIYVPISSLMLSVTFIFIDKQLVKLLNSKTKKHYRNQIAARNNNWVKCKLLSS